MVFLYATAIYSQECEPGFLWVEDVPSCCGAPAQHCFYETDLNILQEMIDNSLDTINLEMDDNEDGEIEPVELGLTEWVDGRLVALDCFLSDIMNCNLTGPLPENFGDLYDPFGGIKDLQKGLIITPLDPDETFIDDPLRMLRAIRFSVTKDFEIEESLFQAMFTEGLLEKLDKVVSEERIREELQKMFQHDSAKSIRLLNIFDKIDGKLLNIIFRNNLWLLPTTKER